MADGFQGPVVLVGCGRLGSAIAEGWLATGAVDPKALIILTPSSKPVAAAAAVRGARINPDPSVLAEARAVVLSVKPAMWRAASEPIADRFDPKAVIVSVMAGVRSDLIGAGWAGRSVARVMPTTGVATGQGIAAVWSADEAARAVAHALFADLAEIVDLDEEIQMDAATAVAGSGPAYVHAFARALAQGGIDAGLSEASALRLARGAIRSAAAADPSETLESLIARVASPGGTTEAGLKAMAEAGALDRTVGAGVAAALNRARELSRD